MHKCFSAVFWNRSITSSRIINHDTQPSSASQFPRFISYIKRVEYVGKAGV